MTVAMVAEIRLPKNERRDGYFFTRVNKVSIDSSWKSRTDTAEIILPRRVKGFADSDMRELIRRGDQIEVWLGYNSDLELEFTGYVREVNSDDNLVLKCEDEMFNMKKGSVSVSYRSVKLEKLLKDIAPGYVVDAMDVELGQCRFSRMTPAGVMQKLSDEFGLSCFFRGKTLVGAKMYTHDTQTTHTISFERNVKKHSLAYKKGEDKQVKITAESTLSDGKKITVTVGDPDGEERKLSYYNIKSTTELKKLAENDLSKVKLDGFEGEMTCFGIPRVKHGDHTKIKSSRYPERDGEYLVEGVKVLFSTGGYERSIKLGGQAS